MFWTKKANTFNKYKYPKEAIPMKKGKGSAVNELLQYKYKKNPSAPHQSIPKNPNTAPGRKVLLNCNLLIKQATIITAAAIEKGTGKLLGVVSTY